MVSTPRDTGRPVGVGGARELISMKWNWGEACQCLHCGLLFELEVD